MKLSVIDQSPVPAGRTPSEALTNTIDLARRADALGYTRYWIAEHHAMEALASPAPEILLARIGAETTRIRIGSGGIMLPHYAPLKVAETFRTLHALYPDRIDLGVGRAPGGSPLEAYALRFDRETPPTDDFPQRLLELQAFLDAGFPESHPFARIRVAPAMPGGPDVWLLGSSLWSAAAAAQLGLPYAFAHFIDQRPTREAIARYRTDFVPSAAGTGPQAIVALGVVCAPTDEEARYLATSSQLMIRRIRQGDLRPVPPPEEAAPLLGPSPEPLPTERGAAWPRVIAGSPTTVRAILDEIASTLAVEELMIVTIVHDHRARVRSYELLAEAYGLAASVPVPTVPAYA